MTVAIAAEHYDIIIIGTGAGGGTLLHRLAPSGKKILILELGGYLPREKETNFLGRSNASIAQTSNPSSPIE